MAGPLSGIKVLDLSRILAGPWATQVLADFGAEVIKVERPGEGDDTRHWGPPYLQQSETGEAEQESDAAYFLSANRGKRSITLDFTKPQGREILYRLLKNADVLVENFKVGGLAKYGLDYASVKALNPEIIYCSITGFGQSGPYAERAGYDAIIQAMGGLMSVTGEADGAPQKVGVAVADLMTGMYAVSAISAALLHRLKTGQGQQIDLALLDTQVAWLANQNMNYLVGGEIPRRHGSAHPNIVPYQAVKASDGYFMLAVGNDRQFSRFCQQLARPDWALDPDFRTNADRVANRQLLIEKIEQVLASEQCVFWLERLHKAQVPCSPINNIAEVFNDPQVKARDMQFELTREGAGQIAQVANPVKFSETPLEYSLAPPRLSQDTAKVLKNSGYTEDEIRCLREDGVI